MTSDGKAKRVEQKDFPKQGRYGKGIIAWDLAKGVTLAGMVAGKDNWVATIHLAKAAAKSHRLDEAKLRKRAATRGEALVEIKAGDAVTGVTLGWMVDRYIKLDRAGERANGKKPATKAAAVKTAVAQQKAPARTPASEKTPIKRAPAKKPAVKRAPAKKPTAIKAPSKKKPGAKAPAKKTKF
jgi:hypothetical protein